MNINLKDKSVYIPIAFFVITLVSTSIAGSIQAGGKPFDNINDIILGLPFSLALIPILLAHELGHFFTAKTHGIKTSLPYFIPGFSIIGTFGAFIRLKSQITNKKVLLDIGASGPLAGFIVSIIAILIGLPLSEYVTNIPHNAIKQGSPLILTVLERIMLGHAEEGLSLILHPIAFAGWIGLFLTSINLMPIGQLDGGHILYALFPKQHATVSMLLPTIMVGLGFFGWPGWYLWAFLTAFIGPGHPKLKDADTPLDKTRLMIAKISLIVFLLTFIPVPFHF